MRMRQILFPTDFSPASEAARRVAVEMARESGATLHVVHVVPPATDPSLPAEQLTELAKDLGKKGLRLTTALLEGRAGPETVRYAREQRIDLIVLGTHGRTGLTRALLGSVAEYVVRLAPCLVLTVPAGLSDEAPAPAEAEPTAPAPRACLVCSRASDDLICETCRNRIRAEALHDKQEAERPGRRGLSV